jgi:hypothetical protein
MVFPVGKFGRGAEKCAETQSGKREPRKCYRGRGGGRKNRAGLRKADFSEKFSDRGSRRCGGHGRIDYLEDREKTGIEFKFPVGKSHDFKKGESVASPVPQCSRDAENEAA